MTYAYRTTPLLFVLLPVVAWALLALRPEPVADAALVQADVQATSCDPRADFQIVSVRYRRGSENYQTPQPITNYPGFSGVRTWFFTDPGATPQYGARLIITWQLKNNVRNTEIGDKLMQNAATLDDWYVRVKFHPNITFSGNVSVQGYQIIKEIPLDNLSNSPKSLDFRVVYQDSPTCTSTQDPSQQIIAFYNPDFAGNGDRRGDDRRPPRGRAPLTWTTPITAATLGETPADYLEDKTLSDIVNSRTTGRPDNQLCSACHHSNTGFKYRPPVDQGRRSGTQEITPSLVISRDARVNYRWNGSGSNGIVYHFVESNQNKPPPLEAVFEKWLVDGGQE